jgi:hypothetical protein
MPEESPAVFVFDEDPLPSVYPSLLAAAADMEAVFVDDGVYDALYTVDGRVVSAGTEDGRVVLTVTDARDAHDLRRRLSEWCERGRLASDPADPVAVANELLRRQWDSRWPKRPGWLSRRMHGEHPPQI